MALAVSDGRLLFTNHVSLLQRVFLKKTGNEIPPLVTHPHFRAVTAELNRLIPEQVSIRLFARLADDIRGTYVLTQTNRLDGAETLVAFLLRSWLAEAKITLDATKMPPFEKIGGHLQPYGVAVVTRPDGWDMVGIVQKPPKP
jgi:hypothetical protein